MTASVVLPMRIEVLELERLSTTPAPAPSNIAPRRLTAPKALIGIAPWAGLAGAYAAAAIEVAVADDVHAGSLLGGYALVIALFTAVAYQYVDKAWQALPTTAILTCCFVVEVIVGAALVIFTVGIGYVALGIILSWAVINSYSKRLARARGARFAPPRWYRPPPGPPTPPWASPSAPPPPMPRPPSQDS